MLTVLWLLVHPKVALASWDTLMRYLYRYACMEIQHGVGSMIDALMKVKSGIRQILVSILYEHVFSTYKSFLYKMRVCMRKPTLLGSNQV